MDLSSRLAGIPALSPDQPAWQFQGAWRPWSYLTNTTASLNGLLVGSGVDRGTGTQVGVVMRNRPEVAAVAVALLATHRCMVTLSSAIPVAVLADELVQLRLPVVVVSEVDLAEPIIAACRQVGTAMVVVSDRADGDGAAVWTRVAVPGDRTAALASPTPDVAVRMLTSGTTGAPKRVELLYRSLEIEAESTARYSKAGRAGVAPRLSRGVAIVWLPLLHVAGVRALVASVLSGQRLALMERFEVDGWVRLVREHRPTTVLLVPATLRMVYDAEVPPEVFDGLSAVFCGTAPLDRELAAEFSARYGIPVLEVYGATEFAGGVAGWTLKDWQRYGSRKADSVGRANAGIDLRVADPNTGADLGADQPGVLEVKGAQLAQEGWVRTTDRAVIDDEGFLYILGRADDVIIRGGLKVHAGDVEAALRSHSAVRDASVVAAADRRLGAVPVGAVELENGHHVEESELLEHLREKLAGYQLPVRIAVLPKLPRTPSLKVSQPALRALLDLTPR